MASPSLSDEISFVSGVDQNGQIATTSFWTWNGSSSSPAYGNNSHVAKWGSATVGTAGGVVAYAFSAASNWSATEQTAFAAVLNLWAAVANISFQLIASPPANGITITRGSDGSAYESASLLGTAGAGAIGGTTARTISRAAISIDTSVGGFGPIDGSFSTAGGYPWTTMIHEVGHALGLGHDGPYNDGDSLSTAQSNQYSAYDNHLYSVMSYLDPHDSQAVYYGQYPVANANWGYANNSGYLWGEEPTTFMPIDILAIQRLYGAPTATPLSGGQTFGFNASGFSGDAGQAIEPFFDFTKNTSPVVTVWDAGANNTLDLSGFSTASTVNLNSGTFSSAGTAVNRSNQVISMVDNIAIAYNTAIDRLYTGAGNDTITANNDGDVINSGSGNDVITGGSGNDSIYAGTGSNTVDGGLGSDTEFFTQARAGYTITANADGSFTVSGSGEIDAIKNVETFSFADQSGPPASFFRRSGQNVMDFDGDGRSDLLFQNTGGQAAIWFATGSGLVNAGPQTSTSWKVGATGDFNGDGRSDIVWQNSSGLAEVWVMNGSSLQSYYDLTPGAASWKVVGSGDFDGDGKADVVFQNTNGQAAIWFATGSGLVNAGPQTSAAWTVKGAGDFNGDGKSDIVWQNSSGVAEIWVMNGSSLQSYYDLNPGAASWKVVGSGDFDGDGRSDVLFQNTNGQAAIWFATGSGLVNAGPQTSAAWTVKGAGDFNGDGRSDIVWQNSNGTAEVWMMNGSSLQSYSDFNPGSASWTIPGAKINTAKPRLDFDGDGRSDLLFQNTGGQAAIWFATGSGLVNAGPQTSTSWKVGATGDFNGDGRSDIVWQNSSGLAEVWVMNGSSLQSYYDLTPGAASWKVVGSGDFDGDGKADVVFQNTNGQAAIWFATGSGLVNAGPQTSAAWTVKGAGDFNGDGKSDIVWQNSSGVAEIWVMNGSSLQSYYDLNPGAASWKVVGSGDFDGDGRSDVLFQNTNGQAAIWFATGSGLVNAGPQTSTSWTIGATGDFSGDSKTDIAWQNSSGVAEVWVMNGSSLQSYYDLNPGSASFHIAT